MALTRAEWKARALAAETSLATAEAALATERERADAAEARVAAAEARVAELTDALSTAEAATAEAEQALTATRSALAAANAALDDAEREVASLTAALTDANAKLAAAQADAAAWRKKYEEIIEAIKKALLEQQAQQAGKPIFGVNPGAAVDWHLELHVPVVGWKHIRVDADLGGDPAAFLPNVVRWTAAGYKPLIGLLWDRTRMPTEAEARNAGEWARVMQGKGVTALEIGNENLANYGGAPYTDAATYARRLKLVHDSVAGRLPVIAQCDGNDSESLAKMKAAVPDLGNYAEGWVTHSYWPGAKAYLTDLKARLRAAGCKDELWLTEWGFASCPTDASLSPDSYGWGTDVDHETVAKRIATVWGEIRPLIRAAYWYCASDHYWGSDYNSPPPKREQRFGACIGDKTPKPYVAEALKTILAASG